MKITLAYLRKHNACESGIDECEKWGIIGQKHKPFIMRLMAENHFDYANWLIVLLMKTKENKVRYAVYAGSLVLKIYEEQYPNDKRPKKAMKAAKEYLKTKSKSAAAYAADAAHAAADASYAASYAADAAAYAAHANKNIKSKIINYGLRLIKED